MLAEDRLIRYCLKPDTTESFKELLNPDLDWAYLLERARNEGVLSLVYKGLCENDAAKFLIPEGIRQRLHDSYYTIAARNTLLYEKLNNILDSFEQANIEVVLLKGIALAYTIYPDIALRPMYDIDILIHEEDFPLCEAKLRELGYVNSPHYPEDFHKDNMMVDVHWELINITRVKSRRRSYQISMDEIWQDCRLIEIAGRKARILSAQHNLMDLCLHLVLHHGLSGLIWFIDIARLIEHYKREIAWDKFVDDCLRYKIYRPVYYTLCYVKENLGQEIPQFVLDKLRPRRLSFFEREALDLILSGKSIENIRFFFTFLTIENLSDRIRFLREIALPSPRTLSARYGANTDKFILQHYLLHFKSILSSILKLHRTTFARLTN